MLLTWLYVALFYAASVLLIGGLAIKIWQYTKVPAPLKVPTMPAPLGYMGVVLRIAQEIILFKSLFRSNIWIWLFGFVFHFALLLVLLRHLRYFIEPVWTLIILIQPIGKYAGFAMIAGLLGLLARRIFVERIRYISNLSDYFMLILLIVIGGTGLMMDSVMRTDIVQLKAFFIGAITFGTSVEGWQPIPADSILLLHLFLVFLLMAIFPFSKLLHAPGILFSPSRNQVDNSREKRHLAPWAAELEKSSN